MAFMLKKSRSILLIVVAVALAGCTLSPTPQQRAERLIASGEDSMVELQQELAAQRAVPLAQDGKLGELNNSMVVVVEQTELWLNQYRQWLLQYPQLYLLLHEWQRFDETEASLQQRLEALSPAEVDALVTELKAQSSFTARLAQLRADHRPVFEGFVVIYREFLMWTSNLPYTRHYREHYPLPKTEPQTPENNLEMGAVHGMNVLDLTGELLSDAASQLQLLDGLEGALLIRQQSEPSPALAAVSSQDDWSGLLRDDILAGIGLVRAADGYQAEYRFADWEQFSPHSLQQLAAVPELLIQQLELAITKPQGAAQLVRRLDDNQQLYERWREQSHRLQAFEQAHQQQLKQHRALWQVDLVMGSDDSRLQAEHNLYVALSFTRDQLAWVQAVNARVVGQLHDGLSKDNEFYHLGTELN